MITVRMPTFEVLDRYSIWKLKYERIGGEEVEDAFIYHLSEVCKINRRFPTLKSCTDELYNLNAQIWDLEADLRKGQEGELGLEEVGRRALKIRDINKLRITVKNKIIDITGEGYKDIKINHCSE